MNPPAAAPSLDVRTFTVGPVRENAHIVRLPGAGQALLIDPGEEPQRLIAAIEELAVSIEAILITHCHFDHIGAVAPLARATGAPVYCPEIERPLLADIMRFVPWEGFGPYESYEADHTLAGGERLSLAGMDVEVLFTPGHSPGHLTFAIAPAGEDAPRAIPALLSGDVLFQGSVGRVDLPGGDWATLERSIGLLLERFPAESPVHPGHMGATTLARELATNPFLAELRAARRPAARQPVS
ncbi:MAG TPA: MBL fold metallo-hydrolase [Solirubrobacteraceae bacterium]|nr:MBL fold metallo-hydrolase [Solirubrobacteraceae bacterium]